GCGMRAPRAALPPPPPLLLLLLLGPAARAAPRDGRALLFLFAMHDHDRSGQLDGLELLQLLGAVLSQGGAGRPSPEVAALVDRALEQRDRSGDGLLDPPELLLPAPARGPPRGGGAAPEGTAEGNVGEQEGTPAVGEETPGGDEGASSPPEGEGLRGGGGIEAEGQGIPEARTPLEKDETAELETAMEDRSPRVEPPEAPPSPAWGDPGEM
uniref:Cell growth regulator with EF-hand domain 1 n=1 Tax=Gallus gallus TaxID=9031 RepID=A0A8V0Y931_CHICK